MNDYVIRARETFRTVPERYEYEAVLEVSGGPTRSPHDPATKVPGRRRSMNASSTSSS